MAKTVKVKASKGRKAHTRTMKKGAARSVNYGREIQGMKNAKAKTECLEGNESCDNYQCANPKNKAAVKKVKAKVK